MYDFTNIELDDQPRAFVLPQADCIFVTRALVSAGIKFDCYSWRDIAAGEAPISTEEAVALAAENPACSEGDTLCIIESKVPLRYLVDAATQVHIEPLDPDVAAYRTALERRGDDIPDVAYFQSEDELAFCAAEVLGIYTRDIVELLNNAETGDTVTYSGSLDPCMYKNAEHGVTYTGLLSDPITSALREYATSQICIVLRVTDEEESPFYLEDAWPDVDVTIAEPTGRDLTEDLLESEQYQSALPLDRAFLERSVLPGHNHPMQFNRGEPSEEAILLYATSEDGETVCCVSLGMYGNGGLMFLDREGNLAESPYADLPGKAEHPEPRRGLELLDDEVVYRAFAQDFPETSAVVEDLKERIAHNWQEVGASAGDKILQGLETGDFSDTAIGEDSYFPTDAGLFFPLRGNGGLFLDYDDPEAMPFVEALRNDNWNGEAWIVTDKAWYRERFGGK